MDSSSDEEIRMWKEELRRKIEQKKRKKRENINNSGLRTCQSDENPCSSKMVL